jgi:hypothetical protein
MKWELEPGRLLYQLEHESSAIYSPIVIHTMRHPVHDHEQSRSGQYYIQLESELHKSSIHVH